MAGMPGTGYDLEKNPFHAQDVLWNAAALYDKWAKELAVEDPTKAKWLKKLAAEIRKCGNNVSTLIPHLR